MNSCAATGRLHDRTTVDLLYEEVVRLVRVDVSQAGRLAHAIAWIAGKIKNPYCVAQGLRAAGHVRLTKGGICRSDPMLSRGVVGVSSPGE